MIELVFLLVFVFILSLAVYHFAHLATKETSFEEVLANQRIQTVGTAKNEQVSKKKIKRIKSKKEDSVALPVANSRNLPSNTHHSKTAATSDIKNNSKNAQFNEPSTSLSDNADTSKITSQFPSQKLSSISTIKKAEFNLEANSSSSKKEIQLKMANKNNQDKENIKILDDKQSDQKFKVQILVEKNHKEENNKKKSKSFVSRKEEKKVEVETNVQEEMVKETQNKVENMDSTKMKKNKGKLDTKKESENDINLKKEKNRTDQNVQIIGKRNDNDKEIGMNNSLKNQHNMRNKGKMKNMITDVPDNENITSEKNPELSKSGLKKNSSQISNQTLQCSDVTYYSSKGSKYNIQIAEEIKALSFNQNMKVVKIEPPPKTLMQNILEIKVEQVERKVKTDKKKKNTGDLSSRLLSEIQQRNLSGTEIQILIEALLNNQRTGNPGGEWVAKGKMINPASQLKRQLEEAEAKVQEKIETHHALLAKISELRSELNSEKSRNNSLKKLIDDSSALLQQKLDTAATLHREQLSAKVKETKIELNKEYHSKLTEQQQSVDREKEIQMQNFQTSILELEKQLQQVKVSHQESEMRYHQVKNALSDAEHQLKNSNLEKEELVQTCHKYQQHLSSLKDQNDKQEVEFKAHLFEVQQALNASEATSKQILSQLQQSTTDKELLDQKLRNLENVRDLLSQNQVKLKKTMNERVDLENRLIAAENESCNFRELVKRQKLEVERLKMENETLASLSFRPAVEGQENENQHERFENNHFNSH